MKYIWKAAEKSSEGRGLPVLEVSNAVYVTYTSVNPDRHRPEQSKN